MILKKLFFLFSISIVAGFFVINAYLFKYVSSSFVFNMQYAVKYLAAFKKEAIRGENGWYFYGPAIIRMAKKWPTAKNISTIVKINNMLNEMGIRFLVIPVPNKSDVYPELLKLRPLKKVSKQQTRFFTELEKHNVPHIDLLPVFQNARGGGGPVYFKYDSHWNQRGIRIAADTIAGKVRAMLPHLHDTLSLTLQKTTGHRYDDLYRILNDGQTKEDEGPYNWLQIQENNGIPYKSDPNSPVLIFGDSFINAGSDVHADIASHIAAELKHSTRRFFQLNASIRGPSMIKKIIRSKTYKPKIVVWIFISCQLVDEFQLD